MLQSRIPSYLPLNGSITTAQWTLCNSLIIIHSLVWSFFVRSACPSYVEDFCELLSAYCVVCRELSCNDMTAVLNDIHSKVKDSVRPALRVSVSMSIKCNKVFNHTLLSICNRQITRMPNDEDEMRNGNCRRFVASASKVLEQSHRKNMCRFCTAPYRLPKILTPTQHSLTRLLDFDKWGAFVLKNPIHNSHRYEFGSCYEKRFLWRTSAFHYTINQFAALENL